MPDIYDKLFDRIIANQYHPNTHLKEEELAKEFNVSRTPVREALRMLEHDGLVKILPKKGTIVSGFTVDDVEEIYEIRKALEILALKSAIPSLSIQGLIRIRKELQEIENETDYRIHAEFDAKFHNYFIDASANKRLIGVLGQMMRLIRRFRNIGFKDPVLRKSAYNYHFDLINALCVRDSNAAVTILTEHLDESKIHSISHLIMNT